MNGDLFCDQNHEPDSPPASQPLAARMRPRNLDEYVGQSHLLGPGKLLRRAIESDRITSLILYGPPGTGKTSLAEVIARTTESHFERLSGISSNAAGIRQAVASAKNRLQSSARRTLLFVDEIHRFNKAQQDLLLPDVEEGSVRLVGATTENPFFYVNAPLVSRSRIFALEPLKETDLLQLLQNALHDTERGLGAHKIRLEPDAAAHLARVSDGDARACLGALEIAALTTQPDAEGCIVIDLAVAAESIQKKAVVYDRDGDGHYDTISAFIKSVRGSDPDAALYWLAKMLHAGEEPRFITRRLMILASEDIGLADPTALPTAVAAAQAVEILGMPEAELTLAHATIHLSTSPKSNRSTMAIAAAKKDVAEGVTLSIPPELRDGHYAGAERLGHAKGYDYPHDHETGISKAAYLPEAKQYYVPTNHGHEKRIGERLEYWKQLKKSGE